MDIKDLYDFSKYLIFCFFLFCTSRFFLLINFFIKKNSYRNAQKSQVAESGRQLKQQQKTEVRKKRQDLKLLDPMQVQSSIKFPKITKDIDKSKLSQRKTKVTSKKIRKII